MRIFFYVIVVSFVLISPSLRAADQKVYTNEDLKQYQPSKSEQETREINDIKEKEKEKVERKYSSCNYYRSEYEKCHNDYSLFRNELECFLHYSRQYNACMKEALRRQ